MGNGMKSGSGDDPFADMDDDEEEKGQDDQRDDGREVVDTSFDDAGVEPDDTGQESEASGGAGLPWIYKREGISDGRKTRQIHLQEESLRRESSAKSELEAILGETAKKGDIREAALLVGLDHLDEVADQLREWGYDFE